MAVSPILFNVFYSNLETVVEERDHMQLDLSLQVKKLQAKLNGMEIGLARQSSDSLVRITSLENEKRKVEHTVLELKDRVVSSSRKAKAITSELETRIKHIEMINIKLENEKRDKIETIKVLEEVIIELRLKVKALLEQVNMQQNIIRKRNNAKLDFEEQTLTYAKEISKLRNSASKQEEELTQKNSKLSMHISKLEQVSSRNSKFEFKRYHITSHSLYLSLLLFGHILYLLTL